MSPTFRSATENDLAAIAFLDSVAFLQSLDETAIADTRLILDPTRMFVATEPTGPADGSGDDEIVGVAGDYLFDLSVPGGASVPVSGVSWVSVRSTHRRRGILRGLMTTQLRALAAQGLPAAILTATEGGIYRRFGYGRATEVRKVVIDPRRARLATPELLGGVRIATAEQARAAVPAIHERWRAHVPGAISRSAAWWDYSFLDRPERREGMTGRFHLLHPDGYLIYRIRNDYADAAHNHTAWITDYAAATPEAHQALWQVMLSIDLLGSIESYQVPVDDPLGWLLTDSRQVRTTSRHDGIWVRPLDVAALLGARRYAIEIDAVIEVRDEILSTGRYRLRGGPDGAQCEPTQDSADLSVDVDGLGSVYLGGHRLQELATAGQVQAITPGVLGRLDRAFAADRAPFHGTSF